LVLVAVATVLVLGAIGGVLHDRARAQAAADAAALAGAAEGREAAADLAEANGGVLESFEEGGADVRVVVRVGRARAEAQARRGAVPDSG
jgi:Flp pilus assembly protein TadG